MSADVKTTFLTNYIRSLAERTRAEKTGAKWGFDWIIYSLALADDLIPYRLPFLRGGPNEISKTKTEAEFGVDLSFLSRDGTLLTIFVLKDETLTNASWTANNFDADLRRAAAPDLTPSEFKNVREVRIVLAYNKDEDQTGIKLYENLMGSFGSKVGDNARLLSERWNLTVLTEKVQQKLLTPSLLPQPFFNQFSYLCSQFADFRHGSDEWTTQLVPNWRRFLHDLLKDKVDERTVRLLPVALLILREHGGASPTAQTGWIDLAEWAMLEAWRVGQSADKEAVKEAVLQMWIGFYLAELERYYGAHAAELATEDSLVTSRSGSYLDAAVSAITAFWHIARLGILALSFSDFLRQGAEGEQSQAAEAMRKAANWLAGLINANPAALRPLIDLHHIELFLIWRTFWQVGRREDIHKWLLGLGNCLMIRRSGTNPLPFIEGRNSLELVFETVATGEKPPEFCDQSSLLLLCVLELCFGLEARLRDELMVLYYQQIVLGRDSYGDQMDKCQPIDLMGWAPPEDWGRKALVGSLAGEGEAQSIEPFDMPPAPDGKAVAARIEEFVRQSRSARQSTWPEGLPASVIVLACLKHRSPLPPESWRRSIFGKIESAGGAPPAPQNPCIAGAVAGVGPHF